ncbi:hypothetical protein EJB05_00522 [Eragrostis curvula]|uniref:Uncharacterized protein n=1 Tax=Eragrostis curvula TaxID=38414 RepID=A0A5J9WPL9_9POAL|nr:hypothetical protein EJB05_00522 [Eragrostis curvula]
MEQIVDGEACSAIIHERASHSQGEVAGKRAPSKIGEVVFSSQRRVQRGAADDLASGNGPVAVVS